MRKVVSMLAVAVLFSGVALLVKAAEEKTWTGEGSCAKCALKQTTACQNALTVEEGGKKLTYYLKPQDKAFHKNICTETKTIKVTGEITKPATETKAGEIKASKIEVVKE